MKKNGYVNFNFLDSKPNINSILVGLDLDYSNKVIAPDGHELALVAFIPIENLLTIAPQFKTDFQNMEYKDKAIYVFSYYDKEEHRIYFYKSRSIWWIILRTDDLNKTKKD